MSMNEILGVLSVVIAVAGIIPYIIGIFKGEVKPHLFTWLIWAIVVGVGAAAQIADQGGAGAWATISAVIICTCVAILSLKYGEKDIKRLDWIAFVAALSAIPLWIATHNPLYSVVLVTLIDAVAFIPTIRKSVSKPHQENLWAFGLGAVSYGFSVLALENLSFITLLYPVMVIFLNTGFVVLVLLRRRALSVP